MTGVLIKRGNLDTDTHTGTHHVRVKAEIRVMFLQAKERQRCQQTTQSWGRGLERTVPPGL